AMYYRCQGSLVLPASREPAPRLGGATPIGAVDGIVQVRGGLMNKWLQWRRVCSSLSGHTVLAYRNAMKLLLEFASRRHKKNCTDLTLEDLSAETIRRFLDHLEQARHNSVATRNVRLAAIHSFFQYLATTDPRYLVHCQSILAVPFKRRPHRVPDYLERSEIQSLFLQIECQTLLGQR